MIPTLKFTPENLKRHTDLYEQNKSRLNDWENLLLTIRNERKGEVDTLIRIEGFGYCTIIGISPYTGRESISQCLWKYFAHEGFKNPLDLYDELTRIYGEITEGTTLFLHKLRRAASEKDTVYLTFTHPPGEFPEHVPNMSITRSTSNDSTQ